MGAIWQLRNPEKLAARRKIREWPLVGPLTRPNGSVDVLINNAAINQLLDGVVEADEIFVGGKPKKDPSNRPLVGSLGYSIDLVVEGANGRLLAIECDGDLYHGPDRWADDMRRQRILERVGWIFWRVFGSRPLHLIPMASSKISCRRWIASASPQATPRLRQDAIGGHVGDDRGGGHSTPSTTSSALPPARRCSRSSKVLPVFDGASSGF